MSSTGNKKSIKGDLRFDQLDGIINNIRKTAARDKLVEQYNKEIFNMRKTRLDLEEENAFKESEFQALCRVPETKAKENNKKVEKLSTSSILDKVADHGDDKNNNCVEEIQSDSYVEKKQFQKIKPIDNVNLFSFEAFRSSLPTAAKSWPNVDLYDAFIDFFMEKRKTSETNENNNKSKTIDVNSSSVDGPIIRPRPSIKDHSMDITYKDDEKMKSAQTLLNSQNESHHHRSLINDSIPPLNLQDSPAVQCPDVYKELLEESTCSDDYSCNSNNSNYALENQTSAGGEEILQVINSDYTDLAAVDDKHENRIKFRIDLAAAASQRQEQHHDHHHDHSHGDRGTHTVHSHTRHASRKMSPNVAVQRRRKGAGGGNNNNTTTTTTKRNIIEANKASVYNNNNNDTTTTITNCNSANNMYTPFPKLNSRLVRTTQSENADFRRFMSAFAEADDDVDDDNNVRSINVALRNNKAGQYKNTGSGGGGGGGYHRPRLTTDLNEINRIYLGDQLKKGNNNNNKRTKSTTLRNKQQKKEKKKAPENIMNNNKDVIESRASQPGFETRL